MPAQKIAPPSLCWHLMWCVSASRFVTSSRSCLYRNSIKLMHDNAPSHSVEGTTSYFVTFGLEETTFMTWLPFSPTLYPIEQLRAILKRRFYEGGVHLSPRNTLWEKTLVITTTKTTSEVSYPTASMHIRPYFFFIFWFTDPPTLFSANWNKNKILFSGFFYCRRLLS